MQALIQLSIANIRSFVRDRAALFWTFAFPLIFVVLFGLIFQGGSTSIKVGWVDLDGSSGSSTLRAGFASIKGVTLTDGDLASSTELMKTGKVDAILEVPKGYGAAVIAAGTAGSVPAAPVQITVFTDPTQAATGGIGEDRDLDRGSWD